MQPEFVIQEWWWGGGVVLATDLYTYKYNYMFHDSLAPHSLKCTCFNSQGLIFLQSMCYF